VPPGASGRKAGYGTASVKGAGWSGAIARFVEPRLFPVFPGFVPSLFPLQSNEMLVFPVFRISWLAYRNAMPTEITQYSNQLGTLGTLGTELKGKELQPTDMWNRRGTLGTTIDQ